VVINGAGNTARSSPKIDNYLKLNEKYLSGEGEL